MKRSEMVEKIAQFVYDATDCGLEVTKEEADLILQFIEKAGMKPPSLDEDKCQALMHVYYMGYTFNQWDEEFEKDAKAVEAYNKRVERKKESLIERANRQFGDMPDNSKNGRGR